jgi:hypothetical protein
MVLALIAIAVGDELAIAHPGDDDDATLASRSSRSARAVPRPGPSSRTRRSRASRKSRSLGLAALAILAVAGDQRARMWALVDCAVRRCVKNPGVLEDCPTPAQGPPRSSSAFGWGPKGRWFKSSRPD